MPVNFGAGINISSGGLGVNIPLSAPTGIATSFGLVIHVASQVPV